MSRDAPLHVRGPAANGGARPGAFVRPRREGGQNNTHRRRGSAPQARGPGWREQARPSRSPSPSPERQLQNTTEISPPPRRSPSPPPLSLCQSCSRHLASLTMAAPKRRR
ncbi:hypothetical protein chiPu_0001434 [Chiloscyllium punctatum]|uniref:Uncharacterized protein n=1 Tax=Chiloscyllium punctatum TaxID=137246 RepID=A0A401RY20_CHIPU|nr:hypothetical protein [Chiloscyllium punctatum]